VHAVPRGSLWQRVRQPHLPMLGELPRRKVRTVGEGGTCPTLKLWPCVCRTQVQGPVHCTVNCVLTCTSLPGTVSRESKAPRAQGHVMRATPVSWRPPCRTTPCALRVSASVSATREGPPCPFPCTELLSPPPPRPVVFNAGKYSEAGAGSCTNCPAGLYGASNATTDPSCTGQCDAGRYGNSGGQTTSSCVGPCNAG
jgi:hypothetical protein